MKDDLDANKLNAIAFYRTAYPGGPEKAVDLYAGSEFKGAEGIKF